jgi:hypothetical protein
MNKKPKRLEKQEAWVFIFIDLRNYDTSNNATIDINLIKNSLLIVIF